MVLLRVCPSLVEPRTVSVLSSDGTREYLVTTPTLFSDGICDPECPGYSFRGSCRHLSVAMEQVCRWFSKDLEAAVCERCGKEAVTVDVPFN